MLVRTRRYHPAILFAFLVAAIVCAPAIAKQKTFLKSDDATEEDEPQGFLPSYDKLIEGSHADWIDLPGGSLKPFKSVVVKEFTSNGTGEHKIDAKHAAEYGKGYMENWLKEQGFHV